MVHRGKRSQRRRVVDARNDAKVRRTIRPSAALDCYRRLFYIHNGADESDDPYSGLRAARGQAIHTIAPEIVKYAVQHDLSTFEKGTTVEILAHEFPVETTLHGERTTILISGMADVRARLRTPSGDTEDAIFDLKCYAHVPSAPYASNVAQLKIYMEGCGCEYGYVLYMPDSGEPRAFKVLRNDQDIASIGQYFEGVLRVLELPSPPPRLSPDDVRCSFCPFKDKCWGEILDSLEEYHKDVRPIPTIPYSSLSEGDRAGIERLGVVRNEIRLLTSEEAKLRGTILGLMESRKRYIIDLPDGQAVAHRLGKTGWAIRLKTKQGGNFNG